jgi:hypothetical protein
MEMTKTRIETMRTLHQFGQSIKLRDKTAQVNQFGQTDVAIEVIKENIIANEHVSENAIEALKFLLINNEKLL